MAQSGHGGPAKAGPPTLSRDNPVLCCPNYEDLHAGIGSRYICIEQRRLIPVQVDCNPEKIQSFAGGSAPLWQILTHSSRKYQNIHAFQNSCHSPDSCAQAMSVK